MKLTKIIRKPAEELLNLLFPRRCALCDGILKRKEHGICAVCGEKYPLIRSGFPPGMNRCTLCSRPLTRPAEYCESCKKTEHVFTRGIAAFPYRGAVRDGILRLKYGGRAEYASFFAEALCAAGLSLFREWDIQVIVPVPVHRMRLAKRGYNQAEEIAGCLSRLTGIPMDTGLLKRKRNTRAQKKLGRRARAANLRNAFTAGKPFRKYRNVLIVDDIYTTGSTVDAAAEVLIKNGCGHIYFTAVCIS